MKHPNVSSATPLPAVTRYPDKSPLDVRSIPFRWERGEGEVSIVFRIQIIEDSPEAQDLIRRCLRSDFDLSVADTGADGVRQVVSHVPDLILLDVGLPDEDGFDVCARIRSHQALESVPVIFLSGRGDAHDKVKAFKLGADDYVQKPFDGTELRARIEARLRHANRENRQLRFSDLRLDPLQLEVVIRTEDREWACDLTPHEFRLLHCLASRRGEPVSREGLIEFAWAGVTISARTVDTHMSNLRAKLAPLGGLLESVRGVGYRLAKPASG